MLFNHFTCALHATRHANGFTHLIGFAIETALSVCLLGQLKQHIASDRRLSVSERALDAVLVAKLRAAVAAVVLAGAAVIRRECIQSLFSKTGLT
jgi:hypothetical protein